MNGFCGSFSVFCSARYLISNNKDDLWAALALPLAGLLFDFFDGKVARWRNSASMLGQELDSLADLVRRRHRHRPSTPSLDWRKLITPKGVIWCRTGPSRIRHRSSNYPRHHLPRWIHLLWPRPSRPLQCHRRPRPKRCRRQIQIL